MRSLRLFVIPAVTILPFLVPAAALACGGGSETEVSVLAFTADGGEALVETRTETFGYRAAEVTQAFRVIDTRTLASVATLFESTTEPGPAARFDTRALGIRRRLAGRFPVDARRAAAGVVESSVDGRERRVRFGDRTFRLVARAGEIWGSVVAWQIPGQRRVLLTSSGSSAGFGTTFRRA